MKLSQLHIKHTGLYVLNSHNHDLLDNTLFKTHLKIFTFGEKILNDSIQHYHFNSYTKKEIITAMRLKAQCCIFNNIEDLPIEFILRMWESGYLIFIINSSYNISDFEEQSKYNFFFDLNTILLQENINNF